MINKSKFSKKKPVIFVHDTSLLNLKINLYYKVKQDILII